MLKLFARALPFIGLGNLLELCLRFPGISFVVFHVRLTFFFFNWDSLHARLNSHYKACSYKKKKKEPKKIKA